MMPAVFRYRDFRFFFYSHEGSPSEPLRVYVEKDNLEAKLWLQPEVEWPTMMAATLALFAI